jgi:hypothetical protein
MNAILGLALTAVSTRNEAHEYYGRARTAGRANCVTARVDRCPGSYEGREMRLCD